jgi:hypothetical protein
VGRRAACRRILSPASDVALYRSAADKKSLERWTFFDLYERDMGMHLDADAGEDTLRNRAVDSQPNHGAGMSVRANDG